MILSWYPLLHVVYQLGYIYHVCMRLWDMMCVCFLCSGICICFNFLDGIYALCMCVKSFDCEVTTYFLDCQCARLFLKKSIGLWINDHIIVGYIFENETSMIFYNKGPQNEFLMLLFYVIFLSVYFFSIFKPVCNFFVYGVPNKWPTFAVISTVFFSFNQLWPLTYISLTTGILKQF